MILITGATGTVGKELVKLLARPEEPIRVLVRDRNRAGSIAYPGVNFAEGDFARPDSLDAALTGVNKAFLLTAPGERQVELEGNFAGALLRSRLQHVVKLSALGADPESPARFLRGHAEMERRIVESGIPFTFLRANQFMQNFLGFRDSIVNRGEFYAPLGTGCVSIVDARDVAAVAAEVLHEFGHQNKIYEVTGPESLTYADCAERLTFALGKPVAYVDVPPETARDNMLQAGLPEWNVDGILELYAWWKFNNAAEVSGTVRKDGKRDPITFADFAHDYAPQFGQRGRDPMGRIMDTLTLDTMTPGS